MNYIDFIFLIPLIWLGYRGFRRGFIIELASLAGFIMGIYAAIHYSFRVEHFLTEYLDIESNYLPVIAFVIVFIGVVVVVYLLGKILENIIGIISLGFINKIAGSIFGVLKASLFISIILVILNHFNDQFISADKKEKSFLYEPVSKLAPCLWKQLELNNFSLPGSDEKRPDEKTDEV